MTKVKHSRLEKFQLRPKNFHLKEMYIKFIEYVKIILIKKELYTILRKIMMTI